MACLIENHRHNFLIWHEEDLARRDDLPAARIREAKRTIDRHNQLRNDAIEAMDAALLALLPPPQPDAPVHSESPGMMLDRLSILALREYHLEEEATRTDAGPEHRAAAAEKLEFVREQREILTRCLDRMVVLGKGAAAVLPPIPLNVPNKIMRFIFILFVALLNFGCSDNISNTSGRRKTELSEPNFFEFKRVCLGHYSAMREPGESGYAELKKAGLQECSTLMPATESVPIPKSLQTALTHAKLSNRLPGPFSGRELDLIAELNDGNFMGIAFVESDQFWVFPIKRVRSDIFANIYEGNKEAVRYEAEGIYRIVEALGAN